MDTCGFRFPNYTENSTAIFEELSITGAVPSPAVDPDLDADNSTFFPLSSQVSIMPLEPQDYEYSFVVHDRVTTHTLTLKNSNAELYGFALWGRVFALDGLDADPPVEEDGQPGSSNVHLINGVLLMLVLSLIRF